MLMKHSFIQLCEKYETAWEIKSIRTASQHLFRASITTENSYFLCNPNLSKNTAIVGVYLDVMEVF